MIIIYQAQEQNTINLQEKTMKKLMKMKLKGENLRELGNKDIWMKMILMIRNIIVHGNKELLKKWVKKKNKKIQMKSISMHLI